MGRTNNVSKLDFIQGVLATSNPVSAPISLLGVASYSITVRQTPGSTGVLAGEFQIELTDFGGGPGGSINYGFPPRETDWVNTTTVSIVAGATSRLGEDQPTGKFMRMRWVDAGSTTALLDAAVTLTMFTV